MKIIGNNFLSQQVIPGLYASWVNKNIKEKYAKLDKLDNYEIPDLVDFDKTLENVIAIIKDQQDRKKGLEDKLKSILMTITIAVTAMTFSLNYGNFTIQSGLGMTTLLFLFISILYFIRSAIFAVKTLIPVGFHSIDVDVEADINSAEGKITLKVADKKNMLNMLLKNKLLNDNVNLRIQNATSASYSLLRNGLIVFALYFACAITQKVYKGDRDSMLSHLTTDCKKASAIKSLAVKKVPVRIAIVKKINIVSTPKSIVTDIRSKNTTSPPGKSKN